MKPLLVFINGEDVFRYERDTTLTNEQLEFLEKMDRDMSQGIKIRGKVISEPGIQDKAKFVSLNLVKALVKNNDAAISVSCAYLVNRMPALVEIHAKDREGYIEIEFTQETPILH